MGTPLARSLQQAPVLLPAAARVVAPAFIRATEQIRPTAGSLWVALEEVDVFLLLPFNNNRHVVATVHTGWACTSTGRNGLQHPV